MLTSRITELCYREKFCSVFPYDFGMIVTLHIELQVVVVHLSSLYLYQILEDFFGFSLLGVSFYWSR